MKTRILAAAAAFALIATSSFAADIEGKWRTQDGANAQISKCGSSFCIKLTSGNYAGKQIGKLKTNGKRYSGTITDPRDDKTYSGHATVSGSSMKLKGCVLRIACKTQTWNKL